MGQHIRSQTQISNDAIKHHCEPAIRLNSLVPTPNRLFPADRHTAPGDNPLAVFLPMGLLSRLMTHAREVLRLKRGKAMNLDARIIARWMPIP